MALLPQDFVKELLFFMVHM